MNTKFTLILVMIAALACQLKKVTKSDLIAKPREVVVDTVFNNYFLPRGNGFTGGDGTYSVVLPDGRTIWIWGDTFLGHVRDDYTRIKTDPLYIRNCFTTINADGSLNTIHQGEPEEWKSMMIPPEVEDGSSGLSELELWYWPGHGFVHDNTLKVFLSKFGKTGDGMWDFQWKGTELFEFSLPNLEIESSRRLNLSDTAHLGHAVCTTEEEVYIYGLIGRKPTVAKANLGDLDNWQYFDGQSWTEVAEEQAPMLDFSGSEQFSVFAWEDNYILLTQEGDLGTGIYSFTSKTPYGPWVNKRKIYDTPLPENNKNLFTYNALAHPQFIKDNMLLISYNTNSFELQDHYDDALIYRPRFIRVPMENILD